MPPTLEPGQAVASPLVDALVKQSSAIAGLRATLDAILGRLTTLEGSVHQVELSLVKASTAADVEKTQEVAAAKVAVDIEAKRLADEKERREAFWGRLKAIFESKPMSWLCNGIAIVFMAWLASQCGVDFSQFLKTAPTTPVAAIKEGP